MLGEALKENTTLVELRLNGEQHQLGQMKRERIKRSQRSQTTALMMKGCVRWQKRSGPTQR